MTALANTPLPVVTDEPRRACIACRTLQPAAALEPVPTLPGQVRCADEAACRKRFTPRRLARSLRPEASA